MECEEMVGPGGGETQRRRLVAGNERRHGRQATVLACETKHKKRYKLAKNSTFWHFAKSACSKSEFNMDTNRLRYRLYFIKLGKTR